MISMRRLPILALLVISLLIACSPSETTPISSQVKTQTLETDQFSLTELKGDIIGQPTQMLNLGSAHLSQLPSEFTHEALVPLLEPLLDKLAAYDPDIITFEGLSGIDCDTISNHPVVYSGAEGYCREPIAGNTGLDIRAATTEYHKILADWPDDPTADQRRRLAAVFVAAGERPSAQVQWLYLAPNERRTGDGIDDSILKVLNRESSRPNETYEVGVALAVRLGHQRVYAMDDHTSDSVIALAGPDFWPTMSAMWKTGDKTLIETYDLKVEAIEDGDDVLDFYRFMNAPATQRGFITNDFGRAIKHDMPGYTGRKYVAWYETRNLRMVANIRAASGNIPGGRVLNIVGASHKTYLDDYLNMMHDVEVVDVAEVLE